MNDGEQFQLATTWSTMSEIPDWGAREVHVWLIPLHPAEEDLDQLRSWLVSAEQTRADRFLFDKHRQRFLIGRARQRQLLGQYLDLAPSQVDFQYDGLGKPSLRGQGANSGVCFNFSNSGQAALLAVTRDMELGIDLELLRGLTNLEGLAARFFTAEESDEILSLQGLPQQQAFFRCWTRKEAYLKAVGKGLTFPLNRVRVTVQADQPARICWINGDPAAAAAWQLQHLEPAGGYLGALAFQGSRDQIRRFLWTG